MTSLVVEDISYYRATAVFPGLAKGTASPPFASLGGQGRFQVPGGKSVYAYEVGDACLVQSIYPGLEADMLPMPAQGKTAVLAKGVALRVGAAQATGEGMGFGVPIVRYGDGWVYSRTFSDADLSTPAVTRWKRTFNLDEIGGDKAHGYMFGPIPSRGKIEVTYTIDGGGIAIEVKPVWLAPGYDQVGILNEQSAAFDDFAADHQPTAVGPAFGNWISVTGHWARLRSDSLGVEWSVTEIPGAALHGGRELISPDFDWAGLAYTFSGEFTGTTYRISVQEAR